MNGKLMPKGRWRYLSDYLIGGATIWVPQFFGGDTICETSIVRKPNIGGNFWVQNNFQLKFSCHSEICLVSSVKGPKKHA